MRYFPVRTVVGLAYPWAALDIDLGPVSVAETFSRATLYVTDAPSGGNIVAEVRNATGGGGSGIQVTITDGQTVASATGSLSVTAGGRLYLRVISAPAASGLNLQGRLELDS